MRLIAIAGSPSSGKTTLAQALAEHYAAAGYRASYLEEVARDYILQHGRGGLSDPAIQLDITRRQAIREFQIHKDVDIVFTDSPVYLGVVYALTHMLPDLEAYSEACRLAFSSLKRYSYHILLPPLSVTYDGVRTETLAECHAIHNRIAGFLSMHGVEHLALVANSSIAQRVAAVTHYIEVV